MNMHVCVCTHVYAGVRSEERREGGYSIQYCTILACTLHLHHMK